MAPDPALAAAARRALKERQQADAAKAALEKKLAEGNGGNK